MTREIKFKVWNKDEKHFMVGWECAQLVIRPLSGRVTDGATTPNVELLQYTGLKDSKGVEIYEGDILEHPTGIRAKIGYIPEHAAFLAHFVEDGNAQYEYLEIAEKCEVIGNIYTNPELLEEQS